MKSISDALHLGAILACLGLAAAVIGDLTHWQTGPWLWGLLAFILAAGALVALGLRFLPHTERS